MEIFFGDEANGEDQSNFSLLGGWMMVSETRGDWLFCREISRIHIAAEWKVEEAETLNKWIQLLMKGIG